MIIAKGYNEHLVINFINLERNSSKPRFIWVKKNKINQMHLLFLVITILAGGYIGWSIGANDAANCVGANIGSGRMTLKQGIFITCLFSFLGALLLGQNVICTIGKGIVPLNTLDPKIAMAIALVSCFCAGTWVLVATYFKMPVSTSHSIVGAVAGAGLAVGAPVVWRKLLDIFICWILTPVGAAIIAYLLYYPFRKLFYALVPKRFNDHAITSLTFATSIYLAFIWGANDVANVTGVLCGANALTPTTATIIGSIAILIGILTWGYKVIETIGFGITALLPLMTIVAEIASGLNVHLYTILGIPVSTSHSIVGAIFGVGLIRGIQAIQTKILKDIVLVWSLTPFCAGLFSFILLRTLMMLKII